MCYKLGPKPELAGPVDQDGQLGLLIRKALVDVGACLVEEASSLEKVDMEYGKIIRSGVEYLLTAQCYRTLPLYTESTLAEFLDDFKANASAIPDFDRRLRYLSTAFQPCYADQVSRPDTVPEEHWWWDL